MPKLKISHPAVFIFGAGATRGGITASKTKPPLDIDFFDIINQIKGHGTELLTRKVLKSVWDLYGEVSGIGLEQYYRDIETREKIGSFARTNNQPKDWRRRREDLKELIRRVYIHTTCYEDNGRMKPKGSKLHRKILSQIKEGDSIITFNYDTVIEESFNNSNIWNPIDGYGIKVSGISHDWCRRWLKLRNYNKQNSKIMLLKLHGSLHWRLYRNKTIRLNHRPYVVKSRNNKPLPETISILAPGWNKPIDRVPYKFFWKQARQKLEKCNTLIIFGYSLPDTDLLAHALFAEVVRQRKVKERKHYLRELHLVDPSYQVKDKFIKMFTPALGPSSRIFKYENIIEFVKTKGLDVKKTKKKK